jgi:hypothetical protein
MIFKLEISYYSLSATYYDTEVWSQKSASKDRTEFCGSGLSHVKHTPFALEGSELPRMTYACESQ